MALQGRSRVGTRLMTQLTVGDDDNGEEDAGVVRHKLPASITKKGRPHSLMDAVLSNRRPVKKH